MTKSKIDSHFSKNLDEKQLIDKYRISFETMLLTFLLIFIDCMIKLFYGPWAEDPTEMIILISLPSTYFLVRSVMKEAYFSRNDNRTLTLVLSAFIVIINIYIYVLSATEGNWIFENGLLSGNLFQLFFALPFFATIVAYLIKKVASKDVEEDKE